MIIDEILKVIPWILPPILGAVIGYITNAIAIGMLFRPHSEKKIFGLRVPFTPGIIPKQRYELSHSVSTLVSRELFTHDALQRQIDSDDFQRGLTMSIEHFTDLLLNTPINHLRDSFPVIQGAPHEVEQAKEDRIGSLLLDIVQEFLVSSSFRSLLEDYLTMLTDHFSELHLSDLFEDGTISSRTASKIVNMFLAPKGRDQVLFLFDSWTAWFLGNEKSLEGLLTDDVIEKIGDLTERLFPQLEESLFSWLGKKDVRRELNKKGRELLYNVIDKLTGFQRFMVTAGQYDKVISENMHEIIGDLIVSLRMAFKSHQSQILDALAEELKRQRQKQIPELAGQNPIDLQRSMHQWAVEALKTLGRYSREEQLPEKLRAFIKKNSRFKVGTLVSTIFNVPQSEIGSKAAHYLLQVKKDSRLKDYGRKIMEWTLRFFKSRRHLPISHFIHIRPVQLERINHYILESLLGIISANIPQILERVDVYHLVKQKIDSLDMMNVERLVLEVIKKQLRWINVFGAILGAIIGMFQILTNLIL